MEKSITIQTNLDKNLTDLNSIQTVRYTSVKFNGNTYSASPNSNIKFKVVSAILANNQLYDTQRYIDINELKNCFLYSTNLNIQNVVIQVGNNYQINDNKILVDSTEEVIIPVSAYANLNSKLYYLNKCQCKVNNFSINTEFQQNINIILPLQKEFDINLNNYISYSQNNFNTPITAYTDIIIEDNFIENNTSNIVKKNHLSGIFNSNIKQNIQNRWIDNNNSTICIPAKLYNRYYKKQTNKNYDVNSADVNLYFVDAKSTATTIWLERKQLEELYQKYLYHESVFDQNIIFYGASTFNNVNLIKNMHGFKYLDKSYEQRDLSLNIDKLAVTVNSKSNNIDISQHNFNIYLYTQIQLINNRKYFYIKNSKYSLNIFDIIPSITEDTGLSNKIYIDGIEISSITITNKNQSKIEIYKQNNVNQKYLVTSGIIRLQSINATNKYEPIYIDYGSVYTISIINTDNSNIYFNDNKTDNNLIVTDLIAKTQSANNLISYSLNKKIKLKKRLLNTQKFVISSDLLYKDEENSQLLSSMQFDIYCYGQLINLSKKKYILLTKTNQLSGHYLYNNDQYILDCFNGINIKLDSNYVFLKQQNEDYQWLTFNPITNIIQGKIENYQQYNNFSKVNKFKQTKYTFKNIQSDQYTVYKVLYKDLFKFPGSKKYKLKFNHEDIADIQSNQELYSFTYNLNKNKNILQVDKHKITFNTHYLDLPTDESIYKEDKLSSFNILTINDSLIDFAKSLNQNYNISGKFFKYLTYKTTKNLTTEDSIEDSVKEPSQNIVVDLNGKADQNKEINNDFAETPEADEVTPKNLEVSGTNPENPEAVEVTPENLEVSGTNPENPEVGEATPENPETNTTQTQTADNIQIEYKHTIDHTIVEYGNYFTELNIYPDSILYENVIQNYDKYNLTYDVVPQTYTANNIPISGVTYGTKIYKAYAKLQIQKTDNVIIDLAKTFANSKNIIYMKNDIEGITMENNKLKLNLLVIKWTKKRLYFKAKYQMDAILDLQIKE